LFFSEKTSLFSLLLSLLLSLLPLSSYVRAAHRARVADTDPLEHARFVERVAAPQTHPAVCGTHITSGSIGSIGSIVTAGQAYAVGIVTAGQAYAAAVG
jgi:hypothetical protein